MIKYIDIENFQAHLKTRMEFSPGINCIVGVSDTGKSSTIRAFKSVIKKSNMYIRNGVQTSKVAIGYEDMQIARTRTESKVFKCSNCKEPIKNLQICHACGEILTGKQTSDKYEISTNGTTEVYDKFGAKLPEFILEKIRIRPITMGDVDVDINIASQHDDFFFIGNSYSGNLRNSMISSLCKESDIIDNLIKQFRGVSLELKHTCDSLQNEITNITKIECTVDSMMMDAASIYENIQIEEQYFNQLQDELNRCNLLMEMLNNSKQYKVIESRILSVNNVISKVSEMILFYENIKIAELLSLRDTLNSTRPAHMVSFEEFVFDLSAYTALPGEIELLGNIKTNLCKNKKSMGIVFENFDFDFGEMCRVYDDIQTLKNLYCAIKNNKKILEIKISDFDFSEVHALAAEADFFKKLNEIQNIFRDTRLDESRKMVVKVDDKISELRMAIEKELKNSFCPLIKDVYCDRCIEILKNG